MVRGVAAVLLARWGGVDGGRMTDTPSPTPPVDAAQLPAGTAAALLDWYDRNKRPLPWRVREGDAPDPYRIWLSEIMCQQTTVGTAAPYYERFLARFPTVEALAAADQDEVLKRWAGLGYYARARNLHACAKAVVARGAWPETVEGLRTLPGIGAYTAAAVGAIAFRTPAVPLDGNIERVTSRVFQVETPLPKARRELDGLAQAFRAPERPGDLAQSLMDLGAHICTPRKPACGLCPIRPACRAFYEGAPEDYPRKVKKAPTPERRGTAYVLARGNTVLMRRRPERGLLGGLWMVPAHWPGEPELDAAIPDLADEWHEAGEAKHGFSHYRLVLSVRRATIAEKSVRRAEGEPNAGAGGVGAPEGFAWKRPGDVGRSTLLDRILGAAEIKVS